MEDLDFNAVLTDIMTPTLDAIIASLEQIAEAAGQAADAMSAAFSEASASADALAGSTDAAAMSTDALAGSMDASTASTDANTASTKANAGAADAAAGSHVKLADAAKAMIMPLGIATALVVGTGVAAIHMAGDFQSGLTTLVTGAGELQSNMGLMHDGILKISAATGESTSQLIQGAFMIESAGHHGKDALDVLTAAAEGAKVGAADLGVVADGTTTIMTDFASTHITASQAVNALIATVASGKTHMQDLSQSLAQILPTASAAHIGLRDVLGAMATMTGEGVPAANAATYLRQTIIALEAPSKQTTDALKSVGLTTTQVAGWMQESLPFALANITEAVGKKFPEGSSQYVEAIKAIAGGSKQMQGILDLTGTHLNTFAANTKTVSDAARTSGSSINGWALVQKDFNQQMSQMGATLGVAMIKIGEALMPVATALAQNLQPALTWLMDHGKIVAIVLGVLAVAFAGALVAALTMATISFISLNIAALPWIALGAAIALVIAGLVIAVIYLHTHWKQIGDWLAGEWHTIMTAVGGWFSALGTKAHDLAQSVGGAFATIGQGFGAVFSETGTRLHAIWNDIEVIFRAGVTLVHNIVFGFVNGIVGLFAWLYNHNYYFRDLVEGIKAQFHLAQQIVSDVWNAITGFLTSAWNGLVNLGKATWAFIVADVQWHWKLVETYIMQPLQRLAGWLGQKMSEFGATMRRGWDIVSGDAQRVWNGLVSDITNIGGKAGGAVQANVTGPIGKVIGDLITTAETWGGKLIQMLIKGIQGQMGAVGKAAGDIAKNIGAFLGFHSPTPEGPGSDADQWMPNLGRMLTQGLAAQARPIGTAANAVAGSIASALGSPSGTLGPNGGAFPASALATGAGGLGAGGGQTITVVLKDETGVGGLIAGLRMLDPRVRQLLAQDIAREMQAEGLLQGRQPIGYTGAK